MILLAFLIGRPAGGHLRAGRPRAERVLAWAGSKILDTITFEKMIFGTRAPQTTFFSQVVDLKSKIQNLQLHKGTR
jgi:hypothetical protein